MDNERVHADVAKMLTSKSFRRLLEGNLPALADIGVSLLQNDDLAIRQMTATWAIYRCMPREAIEAIMETHLDRPFCFTVDDLLDFIVDRLLVLHRDGDALMFTFPVDKEMGDFAENFRSKTLFSRATAPVSLGEGKLDLGKHSAVEIWSSNNGFVLELHNAASSAYDPLSSDVLQGTTSTVAIDEGQESESSDAEYPAKGAQHILVRLTGFCTPRALEQTALETHTLLKSAWRSLVSLSYVKQQAKGLCIKRRGGDVIVSMVLSDEQTAMLKGATPSDPEVMDWAQKVLGPKIVARPMPWVRSFLSRCLNYYYLSTGKKDTMERRIRNALCLLMESDRQKNQAVHLALCFAAIEALVCDKKDGIAERLSQNVATLLQPDSNERIAAIKDVKKLYDLRSKVLHGYQVEIESGFEQQARKLAAGVLIAVMEWRLFVKRMGEQNKHVNEFFDALAEARVSGSRFVGAPDESSSWLPQVGER